MPKRRSKRNSEIYDELHASPPKRKYDPDNATSGECSHDSTDRDDLPKDEEKETVLYMSPSTIRFAQNTINYKFDDGMKLDETLASLISGDITVESIPKIKVIYLEKSYFTRDNRRLCVFQKYEKYLGEKLEIPVHIGKSEDLGRKRLTAKRRSRGLSVEIINEDFKSKDKKGDKKGGKLLETWHCPKIEK